MSRALGLVLTVASTGILTGGIVGVVSGNSPFRPGPPPGASLPKQSVDSAGPQSPVPECERCGSGEIARRRLALAERMLEWERRSLVGDPIEPPNDIPWEYQPATVEAAFNDVLGACDGIDSDLVTLDCSEFPCIAFQFLPARDANDLHSVFSCPTWPYSTSMSGISLVPGGELRYATIDPGEWSDKGGEADIHKRLRYRVELGEDVASELAPGESEP